MTPLVLYYFSRIHSHTCRPLQLSIVLVSTFHSCLNVHSCCTGFLFDTCRTAHFSIHAGACPTVQMFLTHVHTLTHAMLCKLSCTPVHVYLCRPVQISVVYVDTLTHVGLYRFLLYLCTPVNMSSCTSFEYTRVKVGRCRTLRIFISHVLTMHVLYCKNGLNTSPRWHLPYCTNFKFTRVHVASCRPVQIGFAQGSTATPVGQ